MCPDSPFPIRAGGQMRMASLIQALSEFSNTKVAFIAPPDIDPTISWAQKLGISLEHLPASKIGPVKRWAERIAIILGGTNLRNRRNEKIFFEKVFNSFNPDLIWIETPYLILYALRWKKKIPLIIDYWGTSEGAKRLYEVTKGPLKIWKWLFWQAAVRGEKYFSQQFQNIVCVSSLDAAFFRKFAPRSRIWAIPNGIIQKETQIPANNFSHTPIMILTGDMSYSPNIDAAIWFIEDIFPTILKEMPEAKVQIVGRCPVSEILSLGKHPNVEVKGFVPDISASIAEATIYVLPMRLGSGIRSKLFDVFPLGKAVVSTSIGAEGLELHNNKNCLITDSPEDFARACIQLLKNKVIRQRLGEELKRLAFETYSQYNINRLVRHIIMEITGTDL